VQFGTTLEALHHPDAPNGALVAMLSSVWRIPPIQKLALSGILHPDEETVHFVRMRYVDRVLD